MASSEQNPTLGTLFHSGEDFLKALGPPESFGVLVLFGEEAIDGGLHFDDGSEHATLEPPLGQRGEEGLDSIEPRGGGGREVKCPTWMAGQPCADLRMRMGGVVVGNGMDQSASRHRSLNGVEEADELLVAVLLHASADHAAVRHIDSDKQCGCAVAHVVVRHGPAAALVQRRAWLSASSTWIWLTWGPRQSR